MVRPYVYDQEWCDKECEAFREWLKKEESIFVKTFTSSRGYLYQTLVEQSQKFPELAQLLALAKDWQEQKLAVKGLNRAHDAGMTKFIMIKHHGYDPAEKVVIATDPVRELVAHISGKSRDLVEHDKK